MSDVKLFRVTNGSAEELVGRPVKLEKKLQSLIERHLETFLHVRFVASEYSTGKTHAGRIDTLGLDENFCPTIIEYKRNSNANVINQGLFYLDWLMDHKAEFEQIVQKQFGEDAVGQLDWSAPRLLCIAEDFTRYDSARWEDIRNTKKDVGSRLNKALAAIEEANEPLEGVLKENIDFMAQSGKTRKVPDSKGVDLIQHFDHRHFRLVNENFEFPDLLGAAYEYLIKYFADTAGKKGGE